MNFRCGRKEAACVCNRFRFHRGAHECVCDGSWWFTKQGVFQIKRFPRDSFDLIGPDRQWLGPLQDVYEVGSAGEPIQTHPQQGRMIRG